MKRGTAATKRLRHHTSHGTGLRIARAASIASASLSAASQSAPVILPAPSRQ
jgi:hypothetical protein